MRGETAVARDCRPTVARGDEVGGARIYHWLDTNYFALFKNVVCHFDDAVGGVGFFDIKIWYERIFVDVFADAVTKIGADDSIATADEFFDFLTDSFDALPRAQTDDSGIEGLFGDGVELGGGGRDFSNGEGAGGVGAHTAEANATIDAYDVAVAQDFIGAGDSVDAFIVDRGADCVFITLIIFEAGFAPTGDDEIFAD